MNKQFLAEATHKLAEEKVRLERELADLGVTDPNQSLQNQAVYPESGGNSDDDNAEEVTAYLDGLSVMEKLQTEYRDVLKALESIEQNAYGVCKYCKKPIDTKRLEARPASSACIVCKKSLTQEM